MADNILTTAELLGDTKKKWNTDYLADLYSTVETSGDTSKEYLQMEKSTFATMKDKGYLEKSDKFEDYVTIKDKKRSIADTDKYEDLAYKFTNFMQEYHGAESPEEAALYSYRPGYKKSYETFSDIPPQRTGSFEKDSKTVMDQRKQDLIDGGYLDADYGSIDRLPMYEIQKRLKEKGYDPGKIDSKRGPKTNKAIRSLQEDKGIEEEDLGPSTMEELLSMINPFATNAEASDYGERADGTPKGKGYFGELERPDGGISTEISIGVNFDGEEREIPTLVPGLSEEQKKYLLEGNKPTKEIVDIAVNHARDRISEGKDVFAGQEQETLTTSELFGEPEILTSDQLFKDPIFPSPEKENYWKHFKEGFSMFPSPKQKQESAKTLTTEELFGNDFDSKMAIREKEFVENDPMSKLITGSMGHKPLLGHILQDIPRATGEEVKKADTGGALKVLGHALKRVPAEYGAALIKMGRGKAGADVVDTKDSMSTSILEYAKESSAHYTKEAKAQYGDKQILPFVPIKITDVAQLPESMAYSLASMGVGLATGVPTAFIPLPGARPVAWVAGTAASGKAAYEMSTYSIMQSFLEEANEKSIAERGREITSAEQEQLKKKFDDLANQYGLWEAVPEALSNLAFASIIGGPLGKIMTRMGMKGATSRIIGKLGSLYGEELLTETVTQYNQARIEEEGGVREPGKGDITWTQALKEVAPQTFLLTTILGGIGSTVVAAKNRIKKSLVKEVGEERASELMAKVDAELDENKSFKAQLDAEAEMYGVKVEDIIMNQGWDKGEDVGNIIPPAEPLEEPKQEKAVPTVKKEAIVQPAKDLQGKQGIVEAQGKGEVEAPTPKVGDSVWLYGSKDTGKILDMGFDKDQGEEIFTVLINGKKQRLLREAFEVEQGKVAKPAKKAVEKETVTGTKVDLKQLGKDLGDALPGVGLSIEDVGRTKKREAAQQRIIKEHLPKLVAEAKKLGMTLKAYLKEHTNLTDDQIRNLLNIAKPPEKPILEDEGEEKEHGLSKSVADQAVEEGIISEFGDLPTYKTRNMKDVAARASAFIEKDYDLAMKIALGEAPEQGDLRSAELYTALRVKAFTDGDVDTIEKLALSKTAISLATELGQRVKAYDSQLAFDPVRTIQNVVKERKEAKPKKSDLKKEKEISELKQKLDATESKLRELEVRIEKVKAGRSSKGVKKFGSTNRVFTQSRLDEARESLRKKLSGLHSGIDPTAVVELTEIGGFYFEGGMREFSEWSKTLVNEFGNSIRPHLRKVWDNMRKEYSERVIANSKDDIGKAAEEGDPLPKPFQVQRIAQELVESGVFSRNDLVEQVMEILQESYPDITFRETSDLISGYGRYSKLSEDAVKVILRDIKGQLQQISKLEDMQEGQAPLKTGVERRTPSDEERRLIKLVEAAKRKYNIKTTDPRTQLKNALDSYKTRLRNQINDLETQIRERKKIVKDRASLELDREARALLEKKNALREVFSSIFGKSELSLTQRISMAERALEKSIAVYEKKISEGDISPITKKREPVTTKKIEGLRTRREVLKEQLDSLRDMARPKKTAQEIALQSLKTRLEGETKRLEDRMNKLDFETKQKKETILDAEAQKLKWERDRIKTAYNAAKYSKEGITKEEVKNIVSMAQKALDAQKKVIDKGDWTADNAKDVEDYFDKKNKFEEYVKNLKPTTAGDVVNKFFDYFRASILASPRILRNSFLYQVVPGIERTITKRIVTGAFNDADLKSNIVEKLLAKLSGIKPSLKSLDFIKRQAAMTIRIYHNTGIDISRLDKMDSTAKFFGERVRRFVGKSILEKVAKIVSLGPKWLAGGTDMLFASIGRADTAIMMSKEIAKIEALKGILPDGMTETQRADQLLKESYSFNSKDKRANVIRDAGIMDAHMMNNTQPGWWSDKVIEFRRMMSIGKLNFGKMIIPFAKIANVVAAEGVKTATGYGIAKSIYDINVAGRSSNVEKRAKLMRDAVTNLIRYVGLTGAVLLIASLLDDDDYIGAYNTIGRKEYELARARNAGTNYVRIGGRWVPLRYLPMINIGISAVMTARQAKKKGSDPIGGYLVGVIGQIMDTPGIKETGSITSRIGYALRSNNLEKIAKNMKLDWEGLSNWAKVRMIPSVLSYDVWNYLYPKDKKYDFMGREIEKSGAFKEDKSNKITVEFSRLSDVGYFPTISDPSGKYAVILEESMGEEAYNEYLSGLKRDYTNGVTILMEGKYKGVSDKKKKKLIDNLRQNRILAKIKAKVKKE